MTLFLSVTSKVYALETWLTPYCLGNLILFQMKELSAKNIELQNFMNIPTYVTAWIAVEAAIGIDPVIALFAYQELPVAHGALECAL